MPNRLQRASYPEYADQGLEFWCMAPPQIVDTHYRHPANGSDDSASMSSLAFLPEMLASHRFKAASRKIINAMSHAQKHVSISPRWEVFLHHL